MNTISTDVIIIGGGAAGMMAAGQAALRGKKVLLIEKNHALGNKLKITGGGRCNITNAQEDTRAFLQFYDVAADFLYSPFSQFSVKDTFTFFKSHALPLVVQANNRAFPYTENAYDVYITLKRILETNKVKIKTNCTATKLVIQNNKIIAIETSLGTFKANSFILSTGGISHPETGSTGDGFRWLSELGHTVHSPTPTIVPLAVYDAWVKTLAGTSLKDVKISFTLDGKKQFSKIGTILCTHFGLSGPTILNSATQVAGLLQSGEVTAFIDTFPQFDMKALDEHLIAIFNEHKNKDLKTVVKFFTPPGTAKAILTIVPEINATTKVHSITQVERKKLVGLLKALPVTIKDLMGNDRAVSADGGVSLKEIDTKNMQSKLFPNLYIIGDLLHINRPSGGYSLQLCWTTGFVAGNAVI